MLLFLLCAAANDDYIALKALYESTNGSRWAYNGNYRPRAATAIAAATIARPHV